MSAPTRIRGWYEQRYDLWYEAVSNPSQVIQQNLSTEFQYEV